MLCAYFVRSILSVVRVDIVCNVHTFIDVRISVNPPSSAYYNLRLGTHKFFGVHMVQCHRIIEHVPDDVTIATHDTAEHMNT